jgi:AraC family ethanolamine operon transcriptional activator
VKENAMSESSVQVMDFTDPDAFVQGHDIRSSEYVRLRKVAFRARMTYFDLGLYRLRMARFEPSGDEAVTTTASAIVRVACKPERTTLCMPIDEMVGATINGHELVAGEVLLLAANASILHTVHRRHQDWVSLDFPAADFEALLDQWGQRPLPGGAVSILGLPPSMLCKALPAAVGAAAALASTMPEAITTPGCILGIQDGLNDLLTRVFSTFGDARPDPQRQSRDGVRLVNAADEYLREHIARPIFIEELCVALGISPRKLHNAFFAVYGQSPHPYLKSRRLALVHHTLCSGDRSARLVKSVALSHGFWHMGHFARDYLDMFGELPSQTLNGRAQYPLV